MSMKLIPAASILTSASPLPGLGLGTSLKWRASGPPTCSTTIAFTLAPFLGAGAFAFRFPLACDERARLHDGARADESGAGETIVGLNSSPSPHNEREDEQHAEPAQRVTFQNCQ